MCDFLFNVWPKCDVLINFVIKKQSALQILTIPFTILFRKNEIQFSRNEIQFNTNEIQLGTNEIL